MKNVITLLLLTFSTLLTAQKTPIRKHGQGCKEDLFNVQDKQTKLWGYRSFEGEWVIPASYIQAFQFSAGKAKVKKGDKFGMIDCSGYLVINCDYEDFLEFSGDKVWAKKGGLWGLITDKGVTVVAHSYDEVKKIGFENDVVWVRKGDLWGIISESAGKSIVKPMYSDFTIASEQISIVKVKDSLGIIDNFSGRYIIEPKISDMEKIGTRCFAYKINGKWGAVNHLGEKIIASEYNFLTKWQPGLILATKDKKNKIINEKGKSLSATYDFIGNVMNDKAICIFNKKYGFLNNKGALIIQPKFDFATNFYNDKAVIKQNNKYQIIGVTGKNINNIQYDNIQRDSTRPYFLASLQGKNQLIDLTGKMQLNDFETANFHDISTAIRFKRLGKMGVFDLSKGSIFIMPDYDTIAFFRGVDYIVKKGAKFGILNANGTVKIPTNYDAIDYFYVDGKTIYLITQNGKKGLLSDQNTILFNPEYELIAPSGKNFIVKKTDKYGLINIKQEEVIPFKYDYLSNIIEEPKTPANPLIFKKGKKMGLINIKGEEFKNEEANITYIGENLYALNQNNSITILNTKGETTSKETFDNVFPFVDRIARAQKQGKWGYMTTGAKFFIIPQFEEATDFENKLAVVKKEGKYGIIDMLGRVFVPFEYETYINTNTQKLFTKDSKTYEFTKYGRMKLVE